MMVWVGSGFRSVEPSGSATTVLFVGLVEQLLELAFVT
jgi:hypothetical protein